MVDDAVEGDWSPDGNRIAFLRWKTAGGKLTSAVGLVSADGSAPREIAVHDQKLSHIRWSPDGSRLAATELAQSGALHPIFLVNADGDEKRSILTPRAGFAISSLAWSSREEVIYFQNESALEGGLGTNAGTANIIRQNLRTGHFEIWVADADGTGARQLTHDGVDAENPTPTPDGRWVVYASTNPAKEGLWKIRADGAEPTRIVAGNYAYPEVSPDGRYVVYCADYLTERVSLRVAEVGTGASVPFEIRIGVPAGKPGLALGRARWMPGSRAIAFIGQDAKSVNGVYVQDFIPGRDTATTRRPLVGFDPERTTESFGISPDGARVIFAS